MTLSRDPVRARRPGARVVFMSGFTGGVLEEQDLHEPGAMLVAKPFMPWGSHAGDLGGAGDRARWLRRLTVRSELG